MTDEHIDLSEIPELSEEMLTGGVVFPPLTVREPREELPVLLDRDVAKWYRDMGSQYHPLINFLLRRYMQERTRKRQSRTRRVS